MALAFRPRESASSMTSRHGSHALADGARPGNGSAATAFSAGGLRAKVGDHLVGRFCRRSPSPSAGRPNWNTAGLQVAAYSLSTDVYHLFNAPQRPSQTPQRDDLLSLSLVQDIL